MPLFSLLFAAAVAQPTNVCSPACATGYSCVFSRCIQNDWPANDAAYQGRILVENLLEPVFSSQLGTVDNVLRGGPDPRWLHLHRGQPSASKSQVSVEWLDCQANEVTTSRNSDLGKFQIRYVMGEKDTPVSDWLSFPFTFTIDVDSADFDSKFPEDGIFHLSFQIRGGTLAEQLRYAPQAAHAHVRRPNFPVSKRSPVGIYQPAESGNANACSDWSPNIAYFDLSKRQKLGYPMREDLTPFPDFMQAKQAGNLFIEKLGPHSPLFQPINFVWADPAHNDLPFVRALESKFEESHTLSWWENKTANMWMPTTLRQMQRHQSFPIMDGPRGVGWASGYIQGQFDSRGRFAFVETSGRLGFIYPDGSIKTIAGYVTDPNKDPVWIRKPFSAVRANQILRGKWLNGDNGEFHLPIDVTFDPKNEDILYVAGFEDHCIWKVVIKDLACNDVEVSVFAGDPKHSRGEADGNGVNARFDTPASLVFDPICDCIYVSDQFRGRIRRISRNGDVTTLFGKRNVKGAENKVEFPFRPPALRTLVDWEVKTEVFKQINNLRLVTDSDPDIFIPHTIRVNSKGQILVLQLGFGVITEINPQTGAQVVRARVNSHADKYGIGWAWFDVDRWGNSGGLDAIYWTKFTGQVWGNQHVQPKWADPGCSFNGGQWKNIDCSMEATCRARCIAYSGRIPLNRCPDPCATDMFAEQYAFVPANNADEKSHFAFNQDFGAAPGEGRSLEFNPPHYGWLVAVGPHGSVLWGGIGTHGLIRMRVRRADDRELGDFTLSTKEDQTYTYWNGKNIFQHNHVGAIYDSRARPMTGVIGLAGIHGYDAHNLLGLGANAWAIADKSDEEVLDLFGVSPAVRANADAKRMVLFFLRYHQMTTNTTLASWALTTNQTPRQPGVCGAPTTAGATPSTASTATSNSVVVPTSISTNNCGNGKLDAGEDCEISDGECCTTTCRFVAMGTVCRMASGPCDAIDICQGKSAVCLDLKQAKGYACGNATAVTQCRPQATCDGVLSSCPAPVVFDGRACDDNDPCTKPDLCNHYGECSGINTCACDGAGEVAACDTDKDPCTVDECVNKQCVRRKADVGKLCDDRNPCTNDDRCGADGKCAGKLTCGDACKAPNGSCCDGTCQCESAFVGVNCDMRRAVCNVGAVGCPCNGLDECEANAACDTSNRICLRKLSVSTASRRDAVSMVVVVVALFIVALLSALMAVGDN